MTKKLTSVGKTLECVNVTKLLGVYVGSQLDWKEHVIKLLPSWYNALAVLRKIRLLAPFKAKKQLAECLVLSKLDYRAFSLTWPVAMQIYWNKRKCLHKKRVQLPQDWFGTPTWPPFHCFGTPMWLP